MTYLDANYFLRALTAPGSEQTQREHAIAATLFADAKQGRIEVTCTEVVLHEVLFILTGPTTKNGYGVPVPEACNLLRPFLDMPGFKHARKRALLAALDAYTDHPHLDFSDNLTAVSALLDDAAIATFDRDFDQFPDLLRHRAA